MQLGTDRSLVASSTSSTRFLAMSFGAPRAATERERPPVNLALVLDRSGSMSGRKIGLARDAVEKALQMLRTSDRFSLVVYDHEVDVLVESTPAAQEAVRNAMGQLRVVGARGSTNLGGGWLRGCEQVAAHATPNVLGRVLLLTDGLANDGIVDPDELKGHAVELRRRGVATSTFGVGADFDERLLQAMADEGGGHFYYIERPEQIVDLLTSELGDTLEVVARDVVVDIALPGGVRAELLNAARSEPVAAGVRIDLGDLVANQEVSLFVALELPAGEAGERVEIEARVRDRDGVLGVAPARLAWTYVADSEAASQPCNDDLLRQAAELQAERARRDALDANRHGDFDGARALLDLTAQSLRASAPNVAAVECVACQLIAEQEEYAVVMSASDSKARFFRQHSSLRGRTAEGKTRKNKK
jgi:Ca-activated chloride channel homolog